MARRLYKYKAASQYDIENLLNDALWVSSLDAMNDPFEFGFYVNKDLSLEKIVPFQQWLLERYCCISFSTSVVCRRLWNYYTDAMKGMVIEYSDTEIRRALERKEISSIGVNQMVPNPQLKFSKVATEGNVIYDGVKTDLSEWYRAYIGDGGSGEFVSSNVFFHKDESWKDEKEYRFVFSRQYMPDKQNSKLIGLVPSSITVGYR
ncbi:MAG: DUF2971 domain-containing protein, partial [Firmicutes bacterium]|nr:DUF2971 domain-containing protein [Bacillota bacterium]